MPARNKVDAGQPGKKHFEIDFLSVRKYVIAITVVLMLASVVSLFVRGLNFGIDFTGGVLLEVGYPQTAELDAIRATLSEAGYEGAQVQSFGSDRDVLMRLPPPPEGADVGQIRDEVLGLLRQTEPDVLLRQAEIVSSQVGSELAEQGSLAVLFALLMIFAYVSLRFQWKFSFGAVIALAHDVILTLGVFSLLGIRFDLAVMAALLAVVGYSLNTNIVIFDRIRENILSIRRESVERVMNISINQTLSRTLITNLTTLMVLFSLLFVGGDALYGFSLAMIIGVAVGMYSSIYVASALTLTLNVTVRDLLPPQDKGEKDALKDIP